MSLTWINMGIRQFIAAMGNMFLCDFGVSTPSSESHPENQLHRNLRPFGGEPVKAMLPAPTRRMFTHDVDSM